MHLLRATFLIASLQLVRLARSKRMLFCALLALAPAALALLIGQLSKEGDAVEIVMFPGIFMGLGVGVPILSLIAGSGVVADELDDRTITYVFTRPMPRAALLFGRWLATAILLSLLLAVGTWLFAKAAQWGSAGDPELPPGVVGPLLAMVVLGGLVYSAIFASLGTFLKHPMIVGLAYCFGIELLFANLPGELRSMTVQHYLRSYIWERGAEVWEQTEIARGGAMVPAPEALATLFVILVVALGLGSWVISRRQYVLSA